MKYTLRNYQKQASDAAVRLFTSKADKNGLVILPTGCHAKGSSVLTSDGFCIKVEDVKVGDFLLGNDGTPRKVLELHNGVDDMYKVTPIKGEPFVVNGGHILHLYKTNEGKGYNSCHPRYDEISVKEYVAKSSNYKHLHKLHRVSQIDFGNDKYLFDPYFVGLYLGDGCCINGLSITTQREEVVEYLREFARTYGLGFRAAEKRNGENKAKSYFFPYAFANNNTPNPLQVTIRGLGLEGKVAGDKFIPHQYKVASVEDRFRLLAGLLDTDAFYDKEKNTFEYCSKSKRLADDVVFVCRSLGFFAQIGKTKVVKGESYYRIQISGDLNLIPTKVAIRQGRARKQKKSVLVTGFSVEYLGRGEYFGFTLDGNHLYCDNQFFIHHNSGKSLVIADIASRMEGPLLVFQPSKEILQQNFAKLQSYGIFDCGCYSASVGCKDINRITFATIGSVMNHMSDFDCFKNIIIDECFPHDQYVSTENGKRKIGTLYQEFKRGVRLPLVLSYNAVSKKVNKNKILEIRCNGKKDVYKYMFCKKTIEATDNHPVLTPYGFVPIGMLKEGSVVLCTNNYGGYSFPIPNDDQIDFIHGSLLGDGNLDTLRKTKNVNRLRFVQGEKQKDYLLWKALLMNIKDIQKVDKQGYSSTTIYRFNSHSMIIEDEECTKKAAIDALNPKSLAILYMDDGCLGKEENGATICAVAESLELTTRLTDKLREMGIDCEARESKSSSTNKTYNYIGIRKNGVRVLSSLIAQYVHPSMSYKLHSAYRSKAGSYTWNTNFNSLGGTVLMRKLYLGKKDVYNMEVENDHTYIICNGRYDKNHRTFDDGVIVHNCHYVNSKSGQYKQFIEAKNRQVVGLTATPYRLDRAEGGSILKFLTRVRPRIFSKVIYCCQIGELLSKGYLADLHYYDLTELDLRRVRSNSTGADYDERSLLAEYERCGFYDKLSNTVVKVLQPKSGIPRKGVLVFTAFTKEARQLVDKLQSLRINAAIVTGETPKKEREAILEGFKRREIKVVANVGVLTTGFDYPALDTVVLARPTKSLGLYYQMVGRAIRPFEGKDGWIVDLSGNYSRFGNVADLFISRPPGTTKWEVYSRGTQLTNVVLK